MKVHQEPANDVRVVLSDAFPQLVIALLNLVPLVSSERAIRRYRLANFQQLYKYKPCLFLLTLLKKTKQEDLQKLSELK